MAGLKAKNKGILVGAITSLLFTLFVFCYRYLGLDSVFTIVEMVHHTTYLLLAIIGAIVGVNLSGEDEQTNS
ncbi:TIGR04086 family membrane protein [Gracilibacillus sp. JCM 18860]|uniref:TIGR04086 family membrane protein n=1 Tax=Gracilibacillus sp. JCM 18860 TaxID=1306159 RepID=UPI00325FFD11